jgi:hypothetical protein
VRGFESSDWNKKKGRLRVLNKQVLLLREIFRHKEKKKEIIKKKLDKIT